MKIVVYLHVRKSRGRSTYHVLLFWRDYIQSAGIPAEVYTDKHAVYCDPENPERLAQFGRALAALNIRHIIAHSPQAKGRVERVNRTLQDRLLRALREQKLSSIGEANRCSPEHSPRDTIAASRILMVLQISIVHQLALL